MLLHTNSLISKVACTQLLGNGPLFELSTCAQDSVAIIKLYNFTIFIIQHVGASEVY